MQQTPDHDLVQGLVGRLAASNGQVAAPEKHERLAAFATEDGELIGGASGYTHWGWLFVGHLWVQDAYRQQGLGTDLMNRFEQAGMERGATRRPSRHLRLPGAALLREAGYEVFGQLPDYPPGHTRSFLWKRLA